MADVLMSPGEVNTLFHLALVQLLPETDRGQALATVEFDQIKQQLISIVTCGNYDPAFGGPAHVVWSVAQELATQARIDGIHRALTDINDHGFEE